jgi:tellurite resistance protein TerC
MLFWILFNAFVVAMVALDLFVLHRPSRAIRWQDAALTATAWFTLALLFAAGLYWRAGRAPALEFATAYAVEESLSLDNLFVFLLIFRYFQVPRMYQHKVLFWGILGALFMRGLFIAAGVTLVQRFHWALYVMGAFLVYAGVRFAVQGEVAADPEQSRVLRLVRRLIPVTPDFAGEKFFVRRGRRYATPLLLALLVIESADVAFAVDSIPAVLGITHNARIVYTSNVFAILGLRSLYFALAGLIDAFRYLPQGLAVVLAFIGVKMLIARYYVIPTEVALGVVVAVLAVSVALSLAAGKCRR